MPSSRSIEQLQSAVSKDKLKVDETSKTIQELKEKGRISKEERIKRLISIDEQVMNLQDELLSQIDQAMQP